MGARHHWGDTRRQRGGTGARSTDAGEFYDQVHSLDLPVLVIHGDRDVCQDIEKGLDLATATGGDLLVIEDGGHLSLAREPVRVNLAIKQFVDVNWGAERR